MSSLTRPGRTKRLRVHLEDAGERSWAASLLNVLGGSYGSGQFRFVARPEGDRDVRQRVVGGTFPVMRWQDLDDRRRPNGWIELAEESLDELDRELRAQGWVATGSTGKHWWSRTYARPEPR